MKRLVARFKRYLKIYLYCLRLGAMETLIYRINGLLFGLAPIVWLTSVMVFLVTIYSKINLMAGWSFWEMIFLTATHEVIFDLTWCTFFISLTDFPEMVRTGELDWLIIKPVNLRFLLSFRQFDFKVAFSLVYTLFLFFFSLSKVAGVIMLSRVFGFLVLLLMSYLISYLVYLIFTSFSLFTVGSRYLLGWVGELTDFDRYPAEIYDRWLKTFLLFGLPILFFAYVPTAYVLGRIGDEYILYSFLVLGGLYSVSKILWASGLRKYSSASS